MSSRFEEFQTAVILADNDWRTTVATPYVGAYTVAYRKYRETLDKQKDSDKEAGELFVTAACVATGSVLLGSIGSVALKMLAKRTVIGVARATLKDSMFRLFRSVRKNDGVAFAAGGFIDGLGEKSKKAAGQLVEDYLQATSNIIAPDPLVQFLQVDAFMRANVNFALRSAKLIEHDAAMSEAEKSRQYLKLRAAPLMQRPVRQSPPFKASLAEIIELTFYLSAMLDTDTLEISTAGVITEYGSSAKVTSRSIEQRPLEQGYPKSVMPRTTGNYVPAHQTIAIKRAGGDIQERTNELCKKMFGTNLYSTTMFGFGGPADTEKSRELRIADKLLQHIAVKMKPQNPVDTIG